MEHEQDAATQTQQPAESAAQAPEQQQAQSSQPIVQALKLPVGIVSTGDARRLRRDIADMQDTIQAMRIRTNAPIAKLPRLSRALEEFAGTNRLNFLLPEDRHQAEVFMDYVLKRAPVLHISFASEASRKFTTELVQWLRQNFDTEILVEVGLEPNMAAGCVIRTTNKVFDFSLSKYLETKRGMMMELILGKTGQAAPTTVVAEPAAPQQEAAAA